MNTNPEVEKFALDQIKSHYERMVKARPYFCDMLYWMGRDKAADDAIMKQRENATKRAREDVCRHLSDCHLTSLNVLDMELKDMWEKMVYAHIEEKEYNRNPGESEEDRHNNEMRLMESWAQVCDSAFESIAVILRIVDVIRNRQTLGRPS